MPINRGNKKNEKAYGSLQENQRYKGKFHSKRGTIQDRNDTDVTEAESIKKRWEEYTDELCTKDLHDPVRHDGVITHLQPDILECEINWDLTSITTNKAIGVDGIQLSSFKFQKMML